MTGNGFGSAVGPDGTPGPGTVKKNATINIIASPDAGSRFVSWSCPQGGVIFGNSLSASTTATIITDGDHTLRAAISSTTYFIIGYRDYAGYLEITYRNVNGIIQSYSSLNASDPGGYVYPIGCGSEIISQTRGTALLSGISC
jgi:hypothetical protein